MKEEDRLSMVAHHREKTIHLLSQGDEMIQLFHWDLAINRYYYACFHAVHSLLMSRGLTAHTHGGTLSQFSLHFVKTGLVPIEYGGFFSRMVQLRQKADYNSIAEVSEEEARSIVSMSHTFCDKVIELSSLDNNP